MNEQPKEIGLDTAPLAGISDSAFRVVTKLVGGPDLVYTEMISAVALVRGDRRTFRMLECDPREGDVVFQLFGADPAIMAEAARRIEALGAEAIDLNMACPVRKVVKTGAGLALSRDMDLAARLFEAVRKSAQRVRLSAKLRAGWNRSEPTAVKIARLAEEHGLDGVTIHPRYRTGYDVPADWSIIAEAVSAVGISVTGNGDIRSGADAVRMVGETGCARVMVGRASLGDPWIFRRIRAALNGLPEPEVPNLAERGATLLRHMEMHTARSGQRALSNFRKHLGWYARSIRNASEFRRRAMECRSITGVRELVFTYFPGSGDPALFKGTT